METAGQRPQQQALGEIKEQWTTNLTFSCVKCSSSYRTRDGLMDHYDATRHDQYSSWA